MTRIDTIHLYPPRIAKFFFDQVTEVLDGRTLVCPADHDEFMAALPDIEVLFTFGADVDDWSTATNLKLLQSTSAGIDWLLPATGLDPSVVVCNAKGSHEPHMPEFAIALLLGLAYGIPKLVNQQRDKTWKLTRPVPLSGRTLCIVGLGTIGQSIATRARALGMNVVGVRRSGEAIEGIDKVVTPDNRLEVLSGANAVVVVTPLTDETRGLIGADELAAVAPGAFFVDLSRGGVTNTDALVDALASGHVQHAAVDVFEEEPLPEDSPLWDVPNLFVTPHVAGNSTDYQRLIAEQFRINLEAVEQGEPAPCEVDLQLGY